MIEESRELVCSYGAYRPAKALLTIIPRSLKGHRISRIERRQELNYTDQTEFWRRTRIGSPIFQIERTTMTSGDKPVDYEVLSYRGDLVRFVTRLHRRPENVAGSRALRSRAR